MSMIICLSGSNFCSMVSDGRRIKMEDGSVLNEDEKKIFKLNERVLFGAAGVFSEQEQILDAIASVPNLEKASAKIIKNAVLAYLKKNRDNVYWRSYLIGEKTRDGSRIYEISFDHETKKATTLVREPESFDSFALSIAVPPGLDKDVVLKDVGDRILRCVQHNQAMAVLQAAIVKASKYDGSINTNTFVESVF